MRIRILMAVVLAVLTVGPCVAEESVQKPAAADKFSVTIRANPNEQRVYGITVQQMTGADAATKTAADAVASMKVKLQFGRREGDGLLPLDISASDTVATVGTEKYALPASDFPKLTLLLDASWKITNVFGIAGSRYANQVPGLNYSNLMLVLFVPDATKPHSIGESWTSKVKIPGLPDDCTVTSALKSVSDRDGAKTGVYTQTLVWPDRKIDDSTASSKATVESTILLDTGKLLKSHAESRVSFAKSAKSQQESLPEQANTKIDITLEK